MSSYRIEPMTLLDLPEVIAIEQASFTNPWSVDAFAREVAKSAVSHPLVARAEGKVAGYCVYWVVTDEMHVQNLAVHPDDRGRGIGPALLREALTRAYAAGATTALLEVRESNDVAQRLYARLGFRVAGRRKNYYSHPLEDAILYAKDGLGNER